MQVTIRPGRADGQIAAPPSKSMAHRLLLAAGLCPQRSTVRHVDLSQDISATIDCLRALDVRVDVRPETAGSRCVDLRIDGVRSLRSRVTAFSCRESGSTMRFFLPLALVSGAPGVFTGAPRLLERPMSVYETICREQRLTFSRQGDRIVVRGPLQPGRFAVPGDISSQFVTGLLFALPLLRGDSRLDLTTPTESRSYIDMTLDVLQKAGIRIDEDNGSFTVPGGQQYAPLDTTVEGDHSNAAFLDALGLRGSVTVTGLDPQSRQGDRVYRALFARLCQAKNGDLPVIDVRDCPDLAPILMVVAALNGGVRLIGTARLKLKESDRGAAMAAELAKCGCRVDCADDELTVHPCTKEHPLHAPEHPIDGHNDHRIVMAMAVLLTAVGGQIDGAEAVAKSYPGFFDDLAQLGIDVTKTENATAADR